MRHARADYIRFQDPALENPSLLSEGSTAIAEDEPVMLFRAKDRLFVSVLEHYKRELFRIEAAPNMIYAVDEHIEEAREWQLLNGTHVPDMPEGE